MHLHKEASSFELEISYILIGYLIGIKMIKIYTG